MNFDEIYISSFDSGVVDFEVNNKPILTVIEYVETWLPEFILQNKNGIKNERGLAQRLVKKLSTNLNDAYPFIFHHEFIEVETKGNSPTIDIGVLAKHTLYVNSSEYKKEARFFAFEAKLLIPKEKYRKQEYLIGFDKDFQPKTSGGIERIKKNIHAEDLSYVGMIAFVIKENFAHWKKQINLWIDDLIKISPDRGILWNINDKLFDDGSSIKYVSKFITHSCRTNNSDVTIYHLWTDLT